MTPHDERTVSRLANVCAMLTSPNDGERATAALLASRVLASLGMNWRELVRRALTPEIGHPEDDTGDDESGILRLYRELLEWNGLTGWEFDFLSNLSQRNVITPSERQQACLNRIVRRHYRAKNRDG